MVLVFCFNSCVAQDSVKIQTNETITQHYQRLLKEKVGDSIANIVISAKKVDIICDSVAKKLNTGEIEIAKYIVSDTCNLNKGLIVDGRFYNYLALMFKSKKEVVTIKYDFVLDKLQITDAENKLLNETDLTKYDIVRFGLLAFPKNKYLNRFKTEKK